MTTITTCDPTTVLPAPTATPAHRQKHRRPGGLRGLAAGYRLMAWRALRRGDHALAAMHADCSKAILAQQKGKH